MEKMQIKGKKKIRRARNGKIKRDESRRRKKYPHKSENIGQKKRERVEYSRIEIDTELDEEKRQRRAARVFKGVAAKYEGKRGLTERPVGSWQCGASALTK